MTFTSLPVYYMHGHPLDGSNRPECSTSDTYETNISQIGLEIAVSSNSIFNRCNMDQRLHGKSNPSMPCRGLLWWETAISLWLDWCVSLCRVSTLEHREPRTDILLCVCVCLSNSVIVFVWINVSYQNQKENHIAIFGAGTIIAKKCKTELIQITVMWKLWFLI